MIKLNFTPFSTTTFLILTIGLPKPSFTQDSISVPFGNLRVRSIGPAVMSGRISCLDGVHRKPEVFFIGAANGGIWKTTTAGASFEPVFDEYIQSIGDLRIDQNHPDTIWVGTGEPWVRNSVSVGDGVYVTTNGGKTWSYRGLPNTDHIAKVLIHPNSSTTIYVAAQGNLWKDSEERGVYKTVDFGDNWTKIKYVNGSTGCADLTMHPDHPDTLIAAFWDHRRLPHFFRSGGPGSGLFRTHDGGKTWHELRNGLPEGILGRMAVEYAPSNPDIVYLTVECENKDQKGLYKSEDGGDTFTFINGDFNNTVRPFYFSRLTVDPNNDRKIFKCGLDLTISENGGLSFRTVGSGVHSDIHAVWVPKGSPQYVLTGTDGGGYRSLDGGFTFEMFMNLPLSQFYHVSVDNATPYHIYGGLQDNGSWYGPSSGAGGITNDQWFLSNWGDGFYSFRHPTDPHIIYSESQGGNLIRFDTRDGQAKDIKPLTAAGEAKLRFNWNAPIALSQHQPDRLYFGSQYLFRSDDRGDSWKRISPDLTTNDTSKQKQHLSGGLSLDNSTAENHTTIYTIAESTVDEKVIWVGTDDGYLQVTTDGGKTWSNVTSRLPDLPKGTWCSYVEASPQNAGEVLVTFDGHRLGDKSTYLYHSRDGGLNWKRIQHQVLKGYAHVVRIDPVNTSLFYLGTEFGLFISLDAGRSWRKFSNNLPGVSVMALAIHPEANSLVIGTHGRGIYILDDLTPLRKLQADMLSQTLSFIDLPPSIVRLPRSGKPFGGAGHFVGENPSTSASIAYYMNKRHTFGKMTLEVFNERGELVRELVPGKSAGINLVDVPLRLPPPKAAPTKNRLALAGSLITPALLEGTYQIKITKGSEEFRHALQLAPDPADIYPRADKELQQKTLQILYDLTNELGYVYYALDDIVQSAKKIAGQALDQDYLAELVQRLDFLKNSLVSLEGDFYVAEGEEAIREEISQLYYSISRYPGKPSEQQLSKTDELQKKFQTVSKKFQSVIDEVNQRNRTQNGTPVQWRTRETYFK